MVLYVVVCRERVREREVAIFASRGDRGREERRISKEKTTSTIGETLVELKRRAGLSISRIQGVVLRSTLRAIDVPLVGICF